MAEEQDNGLHFDLPKNRSSVIKVIGVGGGGSNAVNHMKELGIKGVDFMICNTDAQALEHSAVENRIQLGAHLTEGLGAGANPEVGRDSATESLEEIREVLKHNTRMVFITAGMGGGTGTGAAPVIAKLAREMNILTVGIVTKPFRFEGKIRAKQAQVGIDQLRDQVDSLVVINNDKLREVYGNLSFRSGFAKADEVLATAAKGIAEVITYHYTTNIDLRDVRTVLENSGTAIMGSALANGQDRAEHAVKNALDSPLLDNNHIAGAKNVLLLIVSGSGEQEITMDEMSYINEHIQDEAGGNANVIMGIGIDESLDDTISVTIIATGFPTSQADAITGRTQPRVVHPLEEDQPIEQEIYENKFAKPAPKAPARQQPELPQQPDLFSEAPQKVVHNLYEEEAPEVAEDEAINAHMPVEEPEKIVHELPTEDENEPAEIHEEALAKTPNATEEPLDDFSFEVDADFEFEVATEEEETLAAATPTQPESSNTPEVETPEETTFELADIEGEGIELRVEETPAYTAASPEVETEANEENDPFNAKISDVLNEQEETPERIILTEEELPETKSEITPDAPLNTEPKREKVIKHTLEDLLAFEKNLQVKKPETEQPKPTAKQTRNAAETEEEESLLSFKVDVKKEQVQRSPEPETTTSESDDDFFNQPISQASQKKILARKARLEAYNYKFKTHSNQAIEKEPAYKRQGYDIGAGNYSQPQTNGGMSVDGEGDATTLKTNNSFLHDNVD